MSILVNRPAPDFKAAAVLGDGSIGELKLSDLRGKPVRPNSVCLPRSLFLTLLSPSRI